MTTETNVLFYDEDIKKGEEIHNFMQEHDFSFVVASNTEDIKLKAAQSSIIDIAVIDISNPKRSIIEIIRNLKLNYPSVNVILTFSDSNVLQNLGLTKSLLIKLGVDNTLEKPFTKEKLLQMIQNLSRHDSWEKITNKPITDEIDIEKAVRASDDSFTAIKIDNYFSGGVNIFDLYVRVSRNNYIKVLSRGNKFDRTKIAQFSTEKSVEYLYFKTVDRVAYINFINKLLEKLVKNDKLSGNEITLARGASENLIDEVFTTGINPLIIKESETLCRNIYNLIKKDDVLYELLNNYFTIDRSMKSHLFGTTFFSSIICKNVEWASDNTVEKVCLGAMLHDIGKLKLPPVFLTLHENEMSKEQLFKYRDHTHLGAELLHKFPIVNEQIKQIVYQHHEMADGAGFPNGISGIRIYPLVRIVSLANGFANYIVREGLTPKQGIHKFATDKNNLQKYDPSLIRSLIMGFIRQEVKK